jgi:GrpB-like predicted nucleotidyltransferase (UPF0157 family)
VRFRDLLRRSAEACAQYEVVKIWLADQHPCDRRAYTEGKASVVSTLLTTVE